MATPEQEARVAELQKEYDRLTYERRRTYDELRAAQVEAAPVKVGDIVRHAKLGECLVRQVKFTTTAGAGADAWRRPWVVASPRRKSGEFGTAQRNLFSSWVVVVDDA